MDKRDLIAEVVRRTGIRIDEDDPAFAVVILAQLVLEQQSKQVAADLERAAGQVSQQLASLVKQAEGLQERQDGTAARIEAAARNLAETAGHLKAAAAAMAEAERGKAANAERNSQALRLALAQGIKENMPQPSKAPAPPPPPPPITSGWTKAAAVLGGLAVLMLGYLIFKGGL